MTAESYEPVNIHDIVASSDIADLLGVSAPAVSNLKKRHADFPEPFATVSRGKVTLYRRSEVVAWYRRRLSESQESFLREVVGP